MTSFLLFLPLVPILLAFVKGKYDTTPMHYLVLICLLDLMRGISEKYTPRAGEYRFAAGNILSLLEIIVLAQLFKTQMTRAVRIAVNIFLVAFLSSILTWFTMAGWERHGPLLDSILATLTIGIIIRGIFPLPRDGMIYIFQSPFVYIAAGIIFSTLLSLLVEWAATCCNDAYPGIEHRLFLSLALIVKYALYSRAVFAGGISGHVPS